MCILFVYTLLKVVSYDLSVLSMSVMGFQKTSLDGLRMSSIQCYLGFLSFMQSPYSKKTNGDMDTQ